MAAQRPLKPNAKELAAKFKEPTRAQKNRAAALKEADRKSGRQPRRPMKKGD